MHWTTSKITRTFVFSVLATLISLVCATPGMTSPADVRVLVDVSGSMKNADPKAVRGPATALLAALLPDRSKGGIWLFGSVVRELVPYGPVDARWDALGKPIEASIGSTDRFTHMESAIKTGIRAGEQKVSGICHVILITDGIVDVKGGKDASSISRDRIIKSVLPEASERNCRIHTIALSDQADLPLLRQMALETGGLFTLLNRPGDLIPVMLDALELALRSQQLPIRDQQTHSSAGRHTHTSAAGQLLLQRAPRQREFRQGASGHGKHCLLHGHMEAVVHGLSGTHTLLRRSCYRLKQRNM